MREGFHLHEITTPADPDFAPAMELLSESFPPEELESDSEIMGNMVEGEGHRFFCLKDASGHVVGLARGLVFEDLQAGWFVHLALRPNLRGSGLGKELIEAAADALIQDSPACRGFVLEVERLEDAATPEEANAREKRLSFFRQMGAKFLTKGYTQPPTREDTPPVPLNLLWLPVLETFPDPTEVITGFYLHAFGVEADHPWVARALDGEASAHPA